MDMNMTTQTKQTRNSIAKQAAAGRPLPSLPPGLVEQLVDGPLTPHAFDDLVTAFSKAVAERAMNGELSHHLGYAPGTDKPPGQFNERNGTSTKTVVTKHGKITIEVPRDRDGSFEPVLVPKHSRRFTGFDESIISLYARGMTVREIQAFVREQYGTTVSPDFISTVTDEVIAEAITWQNRPLEPVYPVVFFDALRVKIRTDGVVANKAVYLALGILQDGTREVLGLWIEQTEGAKFWLKVFTDLKTRGCHDILIAVVDGLKGLPQAISAAFPNTVVQTCIVHLIRNSMEYASWKERKALVAALKPIYTATTADAALDQLEQFEQSALGKRYPAAVKCWRSAWEHVIPFFAFPPHIRRVIYTTNAIESLNMQLRKIIKNRGHFPSDEAAIKLLWLALRNVMVKTERRAFDWRSAMNEFAIHFDGRLNLHQA
jgi:putative transposase